MLHTFYLYSCSALFPNLLNTKKNSGVFDEKEIVSSSVSRYSGGKQNKSACLASEAKQETIYGSITVSS